MKALAGIGVLEQMSAIKISQPVFISREVRGHPIQDHGNSILVQVIHQIHEILGCAIAGSGSEIARSLISPRAVKRVLHDGHELDVGEVHALSVFGQARRDFTIGEGAVIFLRNPPPRTEMDFVDGNRRLQRVPGLPLLHPVLVRPLVFEIPYHRGGAGRLLMQHSEGIRLIDQKSVVLRNDMKLVNGALGDSGDKPLPDAGTLAGVQGMRILIPSVEAADDRYLARIRRPHTETGAGLIAKRGKMTAQFVVGAVVSALVEKIKILLGQKSHFRTRTRCQHWIGFRP